MFWWLTWNVNSLDNIKQGWVPSGWCGGFRPNILSILVLIRIRINLWQQRPSEHHNNHSTILLEKQPQIAVFHNCATILHSSTSFAGSQFYWTLPSPSLLSYLISMELSRQQRNKIDIGLVLSLAQNFQYCDRINLVRNIVFSH